MSRGQHNSAHGYHGSSVGRGSRLQGKLKKGGFKPIGIRKLERILKRAKIR